MAIATLRMGADHDPSGLGHVVRSLGLLPWIPFIHYHADKCNNSILFKPARSAEGVFRNTKVNVDGRPDVAAKV